MRLRDLVTALANRSALIIGDVMLDEYVWGHVERISPEAPVPVVRVDARTCRPGGAANVATNIAAFGSHVLLCGVVGDDLPGQSLRQALMSDSVTLQAGLVVESGRPTTVKARVVAQNQQIIRLDEESDTDIDPLTEDEILRWCDAHLSSVQVCILSDYAKGVLTNRLTQSLIRSAKARKIPVVVDPKGRVFDKYRSATVVTPNTREARMAMADSREPLDVVARRLLDLLDGADLLITRGADGMSVYRASGQTFHMPAQARQVSDLTGAGDTVVATVALALAARGTLEDAAHLANHAAGLVVGKFGTATVTIAEMLETLSHLPG
jgi:rfaE bifunctional protein kinase chain/domain